MHLPLRTYRSTSLALLVLCNAAACGPDGTGVADRYMECADLVADKDARLESLDCFTPKSREILRGLMREEETSYGMTDALGRYRKLLDYDELLTPAEVHGSFATLHVKKGRRQNTVVFEQDETDGKWRIDAVELVRFWSVLNTAATEE